MTTVDCRNREADADILERFRQAVDDDFNFPAGLAVLFELAKEIYRERNLLVHTGKWTLPRQCWSGNGIRLSASRRS